MGSGVSSLPKRRKRPYKQSVQYSHFLQKKRKKDQYISDATPIRDVIPQYISDDVFYKNVLPFLSGKELSTLSATSTIKRQMVDKYLRCSAYVVRPNPDAPRDRMELVMWMASGNQRNLPPTRCNHKAIDGSLHSMCTQHLQQVGFKTNLQNVISGDEKFNEGDVSVSLKNLKITNVIQSRRQTNLSVRGTITIHFHYKSMDKYIVLKADEIQFINDKIHITSGNTSRFQNGMTIHIPHSVHLLTCGRKLTISIDNTTFVKVLVNTLKREIKELYRDRKQRLLMEYDDNDEIRLIQQQMLGR